MAETEIKSPMPACIFLSKLPQEEMRRLKAALTTAWQSVEIDPPSLKDFHYVPWSNMLGANATLRQIYHLVEQTSFDTGRSCCLLLDAVSGLSGDVFVAQYKIDGEEGSSVRIGTLRHRDNVNAPQCLVDCEAGIETSNVWSWMSVRDPDAPIGKGQERMVHSIYRDTLGYASIPKGAGITDLKLPILCTVQVDSAKLEQFRTKLAQVMSEACSSFVLLPWQHSAKASRAAMFSAASQGLNGDRDNERSYRYLAFLDEQTVRDDSLLLSRFVNLDDTGGNDYSRRRLILERISFTNLSNALRAFRLYIDKTSRMFPINLTGEGIPVEEIRNPDAPLSLRKPLYLHQGRFPDTPTFFLTRLPEKDDLKVKRELETACEYDAGGNAIKRFIYVPWTGSKNIPTPENDRWVPEYMSYLTESSKETLCHALFINTPIEHDGRVIIAECQRELSDSDEYRENSEKMMSIRWGRTPAQQAQSHCTNLSIANVSWNELDLTNETGFSFAKVHRRRLAEIGRPFAEAGGLNER